MDLAIKEMAKPKIRDTPHPVPPPQKKNAYKVFQYFQRGQTVYFHLAC